MFNEQSLCVLGGAIGAINGLTTGKGALFVLSTLGFSMPVAVPLSVVFGLVAGIGVALPALMLARKLARDKGAAAVEMGNATKLRHARRGHPS